MSRLFQTPQPGASTAQVALYCPKLSLYWKKVLPDSRNLYLGRMEIVRKWLVVPLVMLTLSAALLSDVLPERLFCRYANDLETRLEGLPVYRADPIDPFLPSAASLRGEVTFCYRHLDSLSFFARMPVGDTNHSRISRLEDRLQNRIRELREWTTEPGKYQLLNRYNAHFGGSEPAVGKFLEGIPVVLGKARELLRIQDEATAREAIRQTERLFRLLVNTDSIRTAAHFPAARRAMKEHIAFLNSIRCLAGQGEQNCRPEN